MKDSAPRDVREILDRLASRHSVRDFDGSDIDPAVIDEIIADGLNAPSACNHQMWHFVPVSDPEKRAELFGEGYGGANTHYLTASVIIYLCFQKGWNHNKFAVIQSTAAATYHMQLSTHLRGLACVWNAGIGDTRRIARILGIPPSFEIIGALCIGRAKETAPQFKPPRRPLDMVRTWDGFKRPAAACYPLRSDKAYPYFKMMSHHQEFAEWDPDIWGWDRIADLRGYAVFAMSPLAGTYVSKRYIDEIGVEIGTIPEVKKNQKLLEVMPYAGTYTVHLIEKLADGGEIHIAELSDYNIDFVRHRVDQELNRAVYLKATTFENGRFPYGDGTFDIVFLPQILETVPAWPRFLDEIRRIVRPGGQVVLSVRNMISWFGLNYLLRVRRTQVWNFGALKPVSAFALQRAAGSGFEIEDAFGVSFTPASVGRVVRGPLGWLSRLRVMRLRKVID